MGVEAVARQAESSVLVVGACALGAEVAKNIVLGGVKRLSVFDPTLIST
jgi:ubiquitin-activating enzyme E1